MWSKILALSLLMVLGCAKGEEIDLQDVVILPSRPPAAPDASVDSGSEPATMSETSIPAPVDAPAAAVIETRDAAPDTEVTDAGLPSLSDSGA